MIIIDNKLVSEDLIDKKFVCNLLACKGACCVKGDAGAPLEKAELAILDQIYPEVSPYLSQKSRNAIEAQGKWEQFGEGLFVTPLVEGKECAYVVFQDGVSLCGIEMAWRDGKIDFQKPISCHLYPIRVLEMDEYSALNYDKWDICDPACKLGSELGVPVYQFLKTPIVRKFGEKFYQKLEKIAESYSKG